MISIVVAIGEKTSKTLVEDSRENLDRFINKKPSNCCGINKRKPKDYIW